MPKYPTLAARLCAAGCATLASVSTASEHRLEEVLVTASYRTTALNKTAASVSVLSEELIRQRSAQHLENILSTAPNVTWASGSSRSRFVQMRGVGDLEQYYDPKYYPSVGIMLDSLELGDSANAGMLFDIAQVEVLRGPQGTRFGSSAHAGMIKLRSNRPTETFEGEVSGGIADYDSYHAGAVLSGPLGDNLRGRLAVQQYSSDGYIENAVSGDDDSNNFDEFTARGRLEWTPSDNALYHLDLLYFDADNGYDTWSLDNSRTTFTDQPGEDQQETLAATLGANLQLSQGILLETSVSYIDGDLLQSYDADWVSDALCEEFLCSGGNDTSREIFDRERERLVVDLRLLGGADALDPGQGRWVAGLYGNQGEEDLDYRFPSVWYGDFGTNSRYETERFALYGEYEYGIRDDLSISAGLRYERFEDDYSDSNGFNTDNSADLWNAELSLKHTLSDDSLVYLTFARGARPGGVNTTASANQPFMSPVFQGFIADNLSFDDETLYSAEVGVRSQQLDGRLDLNFALFYMDRQNAQLENWMWDGDAGLWIGYLDGTSDASSYGLELQTTLAVTERAELFVNFGFLHTEVDSIEAFDLDANAFVTRENRQQAKSPEYQYNLGTRIALTDNLMARLEIEGQDDVFFGYYHNGRLSSYDLLHASLNWSSGSFDVTLWGRNLSDEDYAVHGLYFGVDPRDDFGAWSNQTYTQLGEPRTYGVDLTYRF